VGEGVCRRLFGGRGKGVQKLGGGADSLLLKGRDERQSRTGGRENESYGKRELFWRAKLGGKVCLGPLLLKITCIFSC